MTSEEILEANRLIADSPFSGLTKDRVSVYWENDKDVFGLHSLKYNTSWDWIMPVCLKIATMKEFPTPMLNGVNSVMPYINAMRRFKRGAINFSIKETFLGVVEFIKWYNNSNKAV